MRKFDNEILARLNDACNGEPIYHVGLGAYDFQLAFGDVERIQTMVKAVFSLSGRNYTWEDGPSEAPVWLLIDQTPTQFELTSPFALRMHLESGDYIEFYTDESQYEAAIFDFGMQDNLRMLDVY